MSYTIDQLRGAWGAGFAAAEKKMRANETLVGRYFLSRERGKVIWQGKVISEHKNEMYEVQLFEWGMGEPTVRRTISIADMNEWLFFETRQEWLDAGTKIIEELEPTP